MDEAGTMTITHVKVAVATVVLACVFGLGSIAAKSHGWYDADCCSGHDCEPVSSVSYVASDPTALPVMIVTTSHGTKPLTPQTKIRQSKDGQMHGCIFQGRLICLYMPPGQ